MSRKPYESNAAYVPALPAELEQPAQPTPRIVHASNQASPPGMTVIGFLIFLVPVVGISAAAWRLSEYNLTIALLVFGALSYFGGRVALIITSGDWLGDREIKKYYSVERQRIIEHSRAYHAWLALEAQKENNRHAEHMTEIRTRVTQLPAPPADPPQTTDTFVSAYTPDDVGEAIAYAESLYNAEGHVDRKKVHANGKIRHGVIGGPTLGGSKRAQQYLIDRRFLIYRDGGYWLHKSRYPTARSLAHLHVD